LPPEQATEEGSFMELLDSAAPPPPILDKQLEAVARTIKPIVVDPDDLDGTAKRMRAYEVRALQPRKDRREDGRPCRGVRLVRGRCVPGRPST
jgi:hypothetical protein